jgi:dienelactone hydrolase
MPTAHPAIRRGLLPLTTLVIPAGIALLLASAACSSPAQRFSRHAASLGMHGEVVLGGEFQHVIFQKARASSRTLHVYIDGDGTPWRGRGPMEDPTPRNPLLVELMALDPAASVYLGRPCYHGLARTPPCTSAIWTRERYSRAVVSSMAAALRRVLHEGRFDRVAWFGYSGGGALAVLLAPAFAETVAVVTMAANLDIDAWADLHGYSRLSGSLNPAAQPPLPSWIRQRHYFGGEDGVVPREVAVRGSIDPTTVTVIPSFDHVCCWATIWPAILAEVDASGSSGR